MDGDLACALHSYHGGNDFFTRSHYEEALHSYQIGCKSFEQFLYGQNWLRFFQDEILPDERENSQQLILVGLRCFLNGGYCHLKLRNFSSAVADNTAVLNYLSFLSKYLENTSVSNVLEQKALMRRSMAYEYIGEYSKAVDDLKCLIELNPNYAVAERNLRLRRLQQMLTEDSQAALQEKIPNEMVGRNQTLRLMLMHDIPRRLLFYSMTTPLMYRSTLISAKLALGNELGLFHRSLFQTTSPTIDFLGILNCRAHLTRNLESKIKLHVVDILELIDNVLIPPHSKTPTWLLPINGKLIINLCCILEIVNLNYYTKSLIEELSDSAIFLEFYVTHFVDSCIYVVPIMSLPISFSIEDDVISNQTSFSQFEDSLQVGYIRPIRFFDESMNFNKIPKVYAYESPGLLGIGGKIWDSSFILIAYLSAVKNEIIAGKRILELGSGTGITGIAISFFNPCTVTMTDLPSVVPLIEANIFLNQDLKDGAVNENCTLRAMALEWSVGFDSIQDSLEFLTCETVIASDVVYYPEGYFPLVRTILGLFSNTHPARSAEKMILAHRHRHPQDMEFFDLLYQQNALEINEIQWKSDLNFSGVGSLSDVRLFQIRRNEAFF